jgi:hypothetical protein
VSGSKLQQGKVLMDEGVGVTEKDEGGKGAGCSDPEAYWNTG